VTTSQTWAQWKLLDLVPGLTAISPSLLFPVGEPFRKITLVSRVVFSADSTTCTVTAQAAPLPRQGGTVFWEVYFRLSI
jgi:hypothetical protein